MTKTQKMNLTEYAASRGVTRQAIMKALESGRVKSPKKLPGGVWEIDPDELDREWSANTMLDGRNRTPLMNAEDVLDFNKARAMKETYLALSAKLKYETELGSLTPIDEVERQAIAQAKLLKEAFLNLPARVSSVLAAETNAGVVNDILSAEIRAILESLTT
jgi:hypothetical protein